MFQVQNHSHNSVDDDDSPLGGINYIAVGDKSKKSAYVPKIARKKKKVIKKHKYKRERKMETICKLRVHVSTEHS